MSARTSDIAAQQSSQARAPLRSVRTSMVVPHSSHGVSRRMQARRRYARKRQARERSRLGTGLLLANALAIGVQSHYFLRVAATQLVIDAASLAHGDAMAHGRGDQRCCLSDRATYADCAIRNLASGDTT